MKECDILIAGGGAAGLMAARVASQAGCSVVLLERDHRPGGKIWISGGGRCNFSNRDCNSTHYYCSNPHFVKSALARWGPEDMLDWMDSKQIAWHERGHGRMFCEHSAGQIVNGLLEDCRQAGAQLICSSPVKDIRPIERGYEVVSSAGNWQAGQVIMALGGAAWPQAGGTTLGYQLATGLGLQIVPTRPGLVPLTYNSEDLALMSGLSGISLMAKVTCCERSFCEEVLFTHRGLSGPAILQASCLWQEGRALLIDWLPEEDIEELIYQRRQTDGKSSMDKLLGKHLPARFVKLWQKRYLWNKPLANTSREQLRQVVDQIKKWVFMPAGTEGLKKAETTLGGVDVAGLSSKTMEARALPGCYFVGELVDVAGQLGGYNLHWAWASGTAAGVAAAQRANLHNE